MMMPERMVLVVDDDPAYVKATTAILESRGYQVDSARGGKEALNKVEQRLPDLILLDVMMDVPLDGVYVTEELLKRRELRHVPVIMISSIASTEYAQFFPQDRYLHMSSWLEKPCPPERLIAEVERILARGAERTTAAS
jgi:CheY-like chemotaxis protein